MRDERSVFEKSQEGQRAYSLPATAEPLASIPPPSEDLRSTPPPLPELSELDLTRHFAALARRNVGIDNLFYPLGSCTMKLNPRINEICASLPGFARTHPLAPDRDVQGNLQMMFELIRMLADVCGMTSGSLVPNAGAQGEFSGVRMIAEYHRKCGAHYRDEMLVPDNAHGTNPATASMAGLKTVAIRTDSTGDLDIEHLKQMLSGRTAGLMLTNPNTLGLFSARITEITELVHAAGGLLFYDGANLNAILNLVRPGDMGFDVMHINLHKTFSTPHGGGGPGSGPIMSNDLLKEFLPLPRVVKKGDRFGVVWKDKKSIGHMASFHGNFAIYLRAYVYCILHGDVGLRRVAEQSVLNANYLKHHVGKLFTVPYPQPCMHEFVVQADHYTDKGVRALDIAKRLLDYGVHAPTIYFPLIVRECMLIEPTECESKATLDRFIAILQSIVAEIHADPQLVQSAPHNQYVNRLDEVKAARQPILKHSSHLNDYAKIIDNQIDK